jgi:D-xylose transport system substrate-binding protein
VSTPLHRLAPLGVALVLSTVGLAACGSNSDNSSSNSSSSGGGVSAACSLDNPPTSTAKGRPGGDPGKASGKVGAILPDTTSSTRYTLYDQPLLKQNLSAAGLQPDVQNAGGSTSKQASIAQSMVGEGVKVLILDSIDIPSGVGVEKQATQAGVKTIDYDRVNLGGTADYYVSYDNQDVGRLQAQTMVDCLNAQGVDKPKIIMMDGGKDVDNNAVLFAKGAHEVLDPLEQAGKLEIVSESVVKGWTISNAAPTFTQALTAAGGQVDGVVAANDDIANAVIGVLKGSGLNGHVVVTGQDAGVQGLQNIITGQQSMTIFKNVQNEAKAASNLAITLVQGKDPSSAGMTLTKFDDPESPSRNLPALLLPPEVITQANIQDIIDAGALTKDQICKGIESDCAKLGLS